METQCYNSLNSLGSYAALVLIAKTVLMAAEYQQGPESTSKASNVSRPRLERSTFWYVSEKHEIFGTY